jgi:hypothetical protein
VLRRQERDVVDRRLQQVTARFIYISDQRSRSPWHDASSADARVSWRVVAGNNRPLGRSATLFPSLAECVDAATLLHREIGRADSSVLFDVADGHWRWTVALGGQSVAMSAHAYKRRIECIRSLEQFIAAAAGAAPEPDGLRRLGPNALRGYAGTVVIDVAVPAARDPA